MCPYVVWWFGLNGQEVTFPCTCRSTCVWMLLDRVPHIIDPKALSWYCLCELMEHEIWDTLYVYTPCFLPCNYSPKLKTEEGYIVRTLCGHISLEIYVRTMSAQYPSSVLSSSNHLMVIYIVDHRYPGVQEAQKDGHHRSLRPLRQNQAAWFKGNYFQCILLQTNNVSSWSRPPYKVVVKKILTRNKANGIEIG